MSYKQQVRDFLQKRKGTKPEIVSQTGLTNRQVTQALNSLISSGGAFKVDMRNCHAVYSSEPLFHDKTLPMPYRPAFEEMTQENYDLWQARNLAMLVR